MKQVTLSKLDLKEDYNMIYHWWKTRTDAAPTPGMLSEYGWIGEVDGRPIAAMFLYPIKGSKTAWIGWPIAAPDSTPEARDTALTAVFDIIEKEARDMGYEYIWTTSGTPAIEQRLLSRGYKLGDRNINQYWAYTGSE